MRTRAHAVLLAADVGSSLKPSLSSLSPFSPPPPKICTIPKGLGNEAITILDALVTTKLLREEDV